jgi:hypothetical protein
MEATTMRKTMGLVLVMFATACGAVQPASVPIGDDDAEMDPGMETGSGNGSGSDTGSGSGSMTPTLAGTLTLDLQADYIDDGSRWWTSTAAPMVRGTYTGPLFVAIQVRAGTATVAATLQGGTWSAQLPAGAIAADDTEVSVEMSDASGAALVTTQMFAYDAAGPAVTLAPSTIKDERGDAIDFSKGEPFHTHAGATVDLAGTGCPVVYKYAYLMDATVPYGVNVTPNPLAWHIKVSDMKLAAGTQKFRVRTDDGTVLRDWSAVPAPDANGVSTIELTRKGGAAPIAALGTRTGQFFVDVRARDWSNNETVKSICFDHHPLQAPVAVSAFEHGSLFSINFAADMAAAFLINASGEVDVMSQTITQQTAEPTTVTWSATSSAFSYTKNIFDGYVSETKAEQFYCLNGTTDPKCAVTWTPATAAVHQDVTGSLTPTLSIAVVDVTSGQTIATSTTRSITVTLPARATGQAGRAYRFVVKSAAMTELQPPAIGTALGDYSLLGSSYTGSAAKDAGAHCSSTVQTSWGPMCQQVTYHYRFSALDRVQLSMTLGSRVQQGGIDAAYVSPSVLAATAMSWDSGNDALPGAN